MMRGRLAAVIVLCVAGGLLLLGSTGPWEFFADEETATTRPTFGGTYRRVLGHAPISLDPAHVSDIYGRVIVRQVFDTLIELDDNLTPVPVLAEFWTASRDGTTWTLTLRQGVRFHHGRDMTAADVVYSFQRLRDPDGPRAALQLIAELKQLKAVDRSTIELSLAQTLAPSRVLLALSQIAVVARSDSD